MRTFKSRTWKRWLVLAGGLAALAASLPYEDPAPVVQAQGPMPHTFSWNDIFRGPR